MTAIPQDRPIPQPQSKAAATVQTSSPAIVATKNAASHSRASSKARASKPRQDVPLADFTSKHSTLALVRRTLLSDTSLSSEPQTSPTSIEGLLPPLTSSNEVDLQLYAIVAIVVKDFVYPWYSKITQDHIFVDEIVQIIAHCSRALEQRIRQTDVAELVLNDLAVLLEHHVATYRTTTSSLAQHTYGVNSRTLYHSLNPHPALDPVPVDGDTGTISRQLQNEVAYRQVLINGALAILLPTEDVQNAPLRVLVCDIIADLIIGQAVAEKVCEGWFLHDAVTKAIAALKQQPERQSSSEAARRETKTKLEQFGLINTQQETRPRGFRHSHYPGVDLWFWRITQWIYLTLSSVWFIMQGLFLATDLPKRFQTSSSPSGSLRPSDKSPIDHEYDQSSQPVLAYAISNFISTLVQLRERMPWLESTLTFWQHVLINGTGRLCATNSVIDRYLHHLLTTYILTPSLVINVIIGLRIGVFPNNSLGPPAPPAPSPEEQVQIRRRAAEAILSLVPSLIAQRYFNTSDEEEVLQHIEEDILDVFGDKYMNKHLIYGILEMILARLVPELQEAGPGELLAERGVNWGGADADLNDNAKVSDVIKKSEVVDVDIADQ